MSEDIERLVRQCDSCALNQKLPVKVPMDPWPTPSHPMERVHLDYAGPVDGHYLLIFVDAYFKFLDVAVTTTISANRTVALCRDFFSDTALRKCSSWTMALSSRRSCFLPSARKCRSLISYQRSIIRNRTAKWRGWWTP
ncbi:hypothetical protein X777_04325 [Ooceraea biroi]|uniref:Integrase catalytic domain-containing protein n=1 Tax=Ooceraea biroi TaxID=2015173 RepID=A0A026WI48_OOCBI|nr:hypothetical protein X777_04325 [Ooceraea biroi]